MLGEKALKFKRRYRHVVNLLLCDHIESTVGSANDCFVRRQSYPNRLSMLRNPLHARLYGRFV